MVTAPARPFSKWRRNSRQMYQVLEHLNPLTPVLFGNRKLGMQFTLLKERQRIGEHTWLLLKPDHRLEISKHEKARNPDRSYFQSTLSILQPGWLDFGHRSRRWNPSFLERISSQKGAKSLLFDYNALSHGPKMRREVRTVRTRCLMSHCSL